MALGRRFGRDTRVSVVLVGVVCLLIALAVAWIERSPFPNGQELIPSRPLPTAELVAAGGRPIDLTTFRGRWLLLYFGFTYCPDICPEDLSRLAVAQDALPSSERLQVVFVSIDPDRDTPDGVDGYARYFHPAFLGATGKPEEVGKLVRAAGTPFPFACDGTGRPDPSRHPASVYVVDPEGRLVARYDDRGLPHGLVADMRPLLQK